MKADINVTPLVDIVLVLLIIFIVITPAVNNAVRLPVARHGFVPEKGRDGHTLTLILAAHRDAAGALAGPGTVLVEGAAGKDAGGHPVSFDLADPAGRGRLAGFIRKAADGDRRVFIKADLDLPYRQVDELFQVCREGGALDASVVTREDQEATDMDTGAQRRGVKSEINVTPLIDVVLVLLIVFIVLVPGLTKALPVAVPRVVRSAGPQPDSRNPPLVVTLDAAGGLLLQTGRIDLAGLADALAPVVQLQPAGMRRVFLKVDGGQPWQKVVDVLDQIRVASERARKETAAKPEWAGRDGGDIKVAITLAK